MRMKKIWIIGIFILMMLESSTFFYNIEAKAEMNQPEFVMGDWWEYEGSYWWKDKGVRPDFSFSGKIEIKDIQNISLMENKFDAIVVLTSDTIYVNDSPWGILNITSYYSVSNKLCLGYVAEEYRVIENTPKKMGLYINAFDPPVGTGFWLQVCWTEGSQDTPPFIMYPISIGKSWKMQTNITLQIINISNGKIEYEDIEYKNWEYECIGKENVKTKAGTYECYLLQYKTYDEFDKETITYMGYFSEKVGMGPVKTEIIIQNLDTKEEIYRHTVELTSFKYSGNMESNGESTPGFEVFLLMVGIGILLVWKKR